MRQILGINVHAEVTADVVRELDQSIARRIPTRVAFLNAHLANLAFKNSTLKELLEIVHDFE